MSQDFQKTTSSQAQNDRSVLGTFTNLTGLLGILLYFTGWLYRWAYFSFFKLDINSLGFPLESFFFVPLQVLFGGWRTTIKAIVAFVILILIVKLLRWLLEPKAAISSSRSILSRLLKKIHGNKISKYIRLSIVNIVPKTLLNESIIVVCVLLTLFQLAYGQGTIDARRDARNDSSLLPVVTLVTPAKQLGLGRNLQDVFTNPSLEEYKIIGDKQIFDQLVGTEISDDADPNQPRVWRLLVVSNGWLYLFPTLYPKAFPEQRPPVIGVRESESGDQLMILSPEKYR